jgi:polar amino acid transport system substrate-binding protein
MVVDGELTGIHIELIREVADQLNLTVTFTAFPWPRAIDMMKKGHADAITFMSPTEERKRFGYFLPGNILSTAPVGLVTLKETAPRIEFTGDLRALERYKIGTIRGYSYGEAFDQATWLKKDNGATNDRQLLRKLKAGRFEIVVAYIHDIVYEAQTTGILNDIKILRPHLSQGHANYLVFSKANHHASLAQRFADTLIAFKSTPRYRELLREFGIREPLID